MKMSDLDVLVDRNEFIKNDVLKDALREAREWIYQLHTLIHEDLGLDIEHDQYVIGGQHRDIPSQERLELYRDSGDGANFVLESEEGKHICDVFIDREQWQDIVEAANHEGVDPTDWMKMALMGFILKIDEEQE